MTAVKGVDISEMNGPVDFSALKRAGVKFVIIRCGYGSDHPGQQDVEFEANVRKAEEAGMPYGVYHYSYAKSAAGGKAEAAHALRLIGGRKPAYGVWYDMEDASTLGGDLAGAAQAFCSEIQSAGLHAGVYANLNWWENYLTGSAFDKYDRWVAQYNDRCQMKKPYAMWQFTDKLVIDGKAFDGNLDYQFFVEEETVTYEQWLAFQKRYEKEQAAKKTSAWAQPAVAYCKENGLMSGDADGKFRPQSYVTRQEAAQILLNLQSREESGEKAPTSAEK